MSCNRWLGHTDMMSGSSSYLALVQELLQHTLLHSVDRTMAHWLPVALPVHFRDTLSLERQLCSSPVRLFPKQIAKNYSCSIPKREQTDSLKQQLRLLQFLIATISKIVECLILSNLLFHPSQTVFPVDCLPAL